MDVHEAGLSPGEPLVKPLPDVNGLPASSGPQGLPIGSTADHTNRQPTDTPALVDIPTLASGGQPSPNDLNAYNHQNPGPYETFG